MGWLIIYAMDNAYLWVKALHIITVSSWFACLFYLPRFMINLCSVPQDSHAERERLLFMARRLYRFGTILMWPALVLGLTLWMHFGIGKGPGNGWMLAKLLCVILAIGYHYGCGSLLAKFERRQPQRSEAWYRWFNESAVVIFSAAVILVVVKPF